jgi:hypothetical protein
MNFEAVKLTRAARGIGSAARALLFDLALYANVDREAHVSQRRLADDLDIDVRRVRRIINELVIMGYIVVLNNAPGRGNLAGYRFVLKEGTGAPFSRDVKEGTGAPFLGDGKEGKNNTKKRAPAPPKAREVNKIANTARARMKEPTQARDESGAAAERWGRVMERLRSAVYPEVFEPWLAPAECLSLAPDEIVLAAPSEFFRRWIQNNLAGLIEEAARAELGTAAAPVLAVVVQEEPETDQGGAGGCRIIGLDQ